MAKRRSIIEQSKPLQVMDEHFENSEKLPSIGRSRGSRRQEKKNWHPGKNMYPASTADTQNKKDNDEYNNRYNNGLKHLSNSNVDVKQTHFNHSRQPWAANASKHETMGYPGTNHQKRYQNFESSTNAKINPIQRNLNRKKTIIPRKWSRC